MKNGTATDQNRRGTNTRTVAEATTSPRFTAERTTIAIGRIDGRGVGHGLQNAGGNTLRPSILATNQDAGTTRITRDHTGIGGTEAALDRNTTTTSGVTRNGVNRPTRTGDETDNKNNNKGIIRFPI